MLRLRARLSLASTHAREREYVAALRPFYHAVATVEEVDCAGVDEYGTTRVLGRELLGRRIVVARLGDTIVAMNGTCPHRGADLSLGWLNDACDAIVCRYHGFEWGADGWIQRIPALDVAGRALPTGAGWRAETYPTIVRYGLVWVCLDQEPRLPIVDVAEDDDPRIRPTRPTATGLGGDVRTHGRGVA